MTVVQGYRAQVNERRCRASIDYPLGAGSQGSAIRCGRVSGHAGQHEVKIAWGASDMKARPVLRYPHCACCREPGAACEGSPHMEACNYHGTAPREVFL